MRPRFSALRIKAPSQRPSVLPFGHRDLTRAHSCGLRGNHLRRTGFGRGARRSRLSSLPQQPPCECFEPSPDVSMRPDCTPLRSWRPGPEGVASLRSSVVHPASRSVVRPYHARAQRLYKHGSARRASSPTRRRERSGMRPGRLETPRLAPRHSQGGCCGRDESPDGIPLGETRGTADRFPEAALYNPLWTYLKAPDPGVRRDDVRRVCGAPQRITRPSASMRTMSP